MESLALLTEQLIGELVPKIGQRLKYLQRWKEHVSLMCAILTCRTFVGLFVAMIGQYV